jgi:hypothetical protein
LWQDDNSSVQPHKAKFFHEAGNGHYDARYFRGFVDSEVIPSILVKLLKKFGRVCAAAGVRPILMHGGLIGWHWNRRFLPWDDDLDLCLLHPELIALEEQGSECWAYDRRFYHFEINPNHRDRATRNRNFRDGTEPNKIDARFIHTPTGIFIDITALAMLSDGRLGTKCPHVYREEDLFPLQLSEIEGVPVWVPSHVEEVLSQEYGRRAVTDPKYRNWRFDAEAGSWIRC